MSDGIITHERLLEIAGLPPTARISTLRKALREAHLPFKEVNGRLLSTESAITAALVGRAKEKRGANLAAFASPRAPTARGVSLRSRS